MDEQFTADCLTTPAFGWPDRRAQFADINPRKPQRQMQRSYSSEKQWPWGGKDWRGDIADMQSRVGIGSVLHNNLGEAWQQHWPSVQHGETLQIEHDPSRQPGQPYKKGRVLVVPVHLGHAIPPVVASFTRDDTLPHGTSRHEDAYHQGGATVLKYGVHPQIAPQKLLRRVIGTTSHEMVHYGQGVNYPDVLHDFPDVDTAMNGPGEHLAYTQHPAELEAILGELAMNSSMSGVPIEQLISGYDDSYPENLDAIRNSLRDLLQRKRGGHRG